MGNVIAEGLLIGGVYGLVALGFVLVFKSSQVMNLAYGQIIAILCYFLYQLMVPWGLPAFISVPILVVVGAVVGVVVERFAIRPLMGQSFLAILMMTLALGTIFQGIMVLQWPGSIWNIPFKPQGLWTLGGLKIMPDTAIAFLCALSVFALLVILFRYTRVGLSMRVVAADHEVAQSLGIRVNRIFSLSWATAGAFAAVCGILLGMVFSVTISLGDIALFKGLTILLVGGLTSIPGALVGGLLIGVSESVGSYWVPALREIVPFIFMLIILLVRPQGLFGQKRIERI
jgi:branched-chain amino acid transport system permease protein